MTKEKNGKVIAVRVTNEQVNDIESVIKEEDYLTQSIFLKEAITNYINKKNGVEENAKMNFKKMSK